MKFNLKLFLDQVSHSFTKSAETTDPLTPRRIGILLGLFALFAVFKLFQLIGFAIDDLFFKDYQQLELSQPVFIIGNPRSGTTYIHRMLAKDKENFSHIRTWEIYFAPSIIQRKIVWSIQWLDKRLGGRIQRWLLKRQQQTWLDNPMHKISLWEAEEDESLLFNIWESIFTSVFFPHPELVQKYAYFDKGLSPRERRKIMRFYRACLRRHLYAHKSNKKFLSKNPAFSAKVASLYEYFPNAKIIYMVRNPLDTVPSMISWMSFQWSQFSDPQEKYLHKEYLIQLAKEWYEYPLEQLSKAPPDSYEIVVFDDLVKDPKSVISGFYKKFGFEISPEFEKVLDQANQRAASYQSKHRYSLEMIGISKERLLSMFRAVLDRFGFDTIRAEP